MDNLSDADITVTSATRSEDEMRADLGAPADAPKPAAAKPDDKAPEAKVVEQEADSDRPDPDVSEAARTLRKNRASDRVGRLKADITLYEDNLKSIGGTPPTFEKRTYANAQAEIDHLTRRRHELLTEFNKTLKQPRRPAPVAAPARPAAATLPAGTEVKPDELPTFEFPSWEEYQLKNPEADYTKYLDERDVARDAHKDKIRDIKENRRVQSERDEANARWRRDAVTSFNDSVATFKAAHADYDEVTSQIVLTPAGQDDSPAVETLRRAVLREGANGPALLYHLAQHPEDLQKLTQSHGPADFLDAWTEVKYAVKAAAQAAPPPVAPVGDEPAVPPRATAKPTTQAPAPLSPVSGGAVHTRTLNQIADDSEDADEYIEKRKEQLRKPSARA